MRWCWCWGTWDGRRECSTMPSASPRKTPPWTCPWWATGASAAFPPWRSTRGFTYTTSIPLPARRCGKNIEAARRARGSIECITHSTSPIIHSKKSFLVFAAVKIIALVFQLFELLLFKLPTPPDMLLVQNPPSIPTLLVAWAVAKLRGAVLVIDWHNLGFSILAHARGDGFHPLVSLAYAYEKYFGELADKHLCVTEAMRLWLLDNFNIQAQVLHDRPPSFFGPTSVATRHNLFLRLEPQLRAWKVEERYTAATGVVVKEGDTLFTTERGHCSGDVVLRETQLPALVVSSTSWTEDEDFGLLLEALQAVDAQWTSAIASSSSSSSSPSFSEGKKESSSSKPFLVVVVTGKGPLKAEYEARMRASPFQRIAVCTMWLEAADYPLLVGSADLGVSLHTSTSGIDLPMKVLDMFGCQVPVCALGFSCLHELVRHGENGLVFHTAADLADCLEELLGLFPRDKKELDVLWAGVAGMARWEENWQEHAAPYLLYGEAEDEGEEGEEEAQGGRQWCQPWMLMLLALTFLLAVEIWKWD